MTTLLTVILLGGLPQDTARTPCDDECRAVLAAVLPWTVERAAEEHAPEPGRLLVDIAPVRNREGQAEELRALERVASEMSLSVLDMSRHPTFLSCARRSTSDPCRAETDLVWIKAYGVSMTGPGRATAYSRIEVLEGFTRWELFLENGREGAWEVVGLGVTVAGQRFRGIGD